MTTTIPPDEPCLYCGKTGCDAAAPVYAHTDVFARARGMVAGIDPCGAIHYHAACHEAERAAFAEYVSAEKAKARAAGLKVIDYPKEQSVTLDLDAIRQRNENRRAILPPPGTITAAQIRTMCRLPDGTPYTPVDAGRSAVVDVDALVAEVEQLRAELHATRSAPGQHAPLSHPIDESKVF